MHAVVHARVMVTHPGLVGMVATGEHGVIGYSRVPLSCSATTSSHVGPPFHGRAHAGFGLPVTTKYKRRLVGAKIATTKKH